MATFTEIRTARKRHVPHTPTGGCEVCNKPIEPGQQYGRHSATPDDEIWSGERWAHMKAHHPYGSCVARTSSTRPATHESLTP